MAWREVLPMDERHRFVLEAEQGVCTFSELCDEYAISRKTGYKWFNRYLDEGLEGLEERSRVPKSCPHRTQEYVERVVEAERKRHPSWGPKKLADTLATKHTDLEIPAPSTIGEVLKRRGLVKPRRRRSHPVRKWPGRLSEPERPNQVWGADFKGWFRTRDGKRCDPLTISDLFSRYVIDCRALLGQQDGLVRPVFKQIFGAFGLPDVIRIDNGPPFGSEGVLGLSALSVWWIQLGIRVEYIEPGCPEQNGVHERMHRTLKAETTCPPERNIREQQKRFDRWMKEFNEDRPHEALGMRRPAEIYKPSSRSYPKRISGFGYPPEFEVRRVRSNGQIVWNQRQRAIGRAFRGVQIGLERIDNDQIRVHAGEMLLGTLATDGSGPLRPTVSAARNHRDQGG